MAKARYETDDTLLWGRVISEVMREVERESDSSSIRRAIGDCSKFINPCLLELLVKSMSYFSALRYGLDESDSFF
jgi:hypothetical protein